MGNFRLRRKRSEDMLRLQAVQEKDRDLLWNINQKYLYEMTNFYDDPMDENGNYCYGHFDDYFTDPKRKAYFIYNEDTIIGFAMLCPYSNIDQDPDYTMAEFTIFPSFRRKHLALDAAKMILDKHRGKWEIKYNEKNSGAKKLWNIVAGPYEPEVYHLNEKETVLAFNVMEEVELKSVQREDIENLWKMQVEAFSDLLKKYQDFDISPATESVDKVMARFEQPWTRYYYIMAGGIKVGAVRVIDKQDGSRKRISPIWIMKEYRNKGYAQQAIRAVEKIYGSDHWCLDTILQEKGNLYLYEKLGYHRTGKVDRINDRMDIVYFEKDEDEHMDYSIKKVTIDDYDAIYDLWNATEQSRRALNPVDDSREGIARYLERNPETCFAAVKDNRIIGVILTGHDGRRAIMHHLCVHPDYRRLGIAGHLVSLAEEALQKEGIQKIFGLVFKDNETANAFWEQQGYSLRTNLNYRNKSLNDQIPIGE